MKNSRDKIAERLMSITSARPVSAPLANKTPKRREDERRSVYRQGKLILSGQIVIACMIVDWSPNGARVELDGAAALPEFLALKVLSTGELRRAKVAWRTEHTAGLSFRTSQQTAQFGARNRPPD